MTKSTERVPQRTRGSRKSASPEALERMRLADAAAEDWEGHCRRCDEHVFGALGKLRKHSCQGEGSE